MCQYDDNEGEERRSGGEVKREAGASCAMDGKETTVRRETTRVRVRHVVETRDLRGQSSVKPSRDIAVLEKATLNLVRSTS